MKIGIIEICEPNHYTAVEALAQTYKQDPNNQVVIFTLPHIASVFKALTKENAIELIIKASNETVLAFLQRTQSYQFDRIHINTISRYFKEFASVHWEGTILFSVHNVEQWFDNGLSNRLGLLKYQVTNLLKQRAWKRVYQTLVIFTKDLIHQQYRNIFVKHLHDLNYFIISYSTSHKKFLSRFVPLNRILVFPFALYNDMPDRSQQNKRLRICIPGTVSNLRRDYTMLFRLLAANQVQWSKKLTIDLLGYIPENEPSVLQEVQILQQKGIDILYYPTFIAAAHYSHLLSQADIILGNLRVELNPYQRYGSTKETGVIFNVIQSGKPAILPNTYPVDEPLKEVCLFYNSDFELEQLIHTLLTNQIQLEEIKARAQILVRQFSPEKLYKQLIIL